MALKIGIIVLIGVAMGAAFYEARIVLYSTMLILGFTALLFTLMPNLVRGGYREQGVAKFSGKSTASKVAERSLFFFALVLIGLSTAVLAAWMIL